MKRWIDMREGERRPAWAAFFTLLGTTAAHTLLETTRDALFLANLPASRLPWMVLVIAALALAISRFTARGRGRPSGAKVSLALVVVGIVTGLFWLLLEGTTHAVVLYALYAWSGVAAAWIILEFWLVLGASFTIAQAKRLFAFIGAGSVLGAVLGAACARVLAPALGAPRLLLVAALLFAFTAFGPAMLPRAEPSRPRERSRVKATDAATLFAEPYVIRILALVLMSTIALTIADYLFKATAAREIAPAYLTEFFATSYFVMSSLALVVQLVGVGWSLRVLGIQRALLVLPLLMVLGAAGVIVTGTLAAAVIMKGADGALRHSLHRTTSELLYVPISDRAREKLKPLIDIVGVRGGQAIASLLVLSFAALGKGYVVLAALVVLFAAAWTVVAASVRRHYLDVFRSTLSEGRIDASLHLPELDLGALETLMLALNAKDDLQVLAAMDLLSQQSRRRLIPALILHHPSKPVVRRALEHFVQERRDDFIPTAERLLEHADPDIRAAALRAISAVAPNEALLTACADDNEPSVRATAIVHLVRHAWLRGEEATRRLDAIAGDPDRAARVAIARAIALEPSDQFERTLARIAESEHEPDVLSEVAVAMGRMSGGTFVPTLIGFLGVRDVSPSATDALVAIGDPALRALAAAAKDESTPREVLWNIPRALSRFDARRAAPILLELLLGASDGVIRYRSLRGLCHLRSVEPRAPIDESHLLRAAEKALRAAFQNLEARVVLGRGARVEPACATAAHKLLCAMLRDKETMATGRLFRLLGLLHPDENFQHVYRGLTNDDPKRRASSRELCEHVVLPPIREAVLALIDDLSDEERLERGVAHFGSMALDYHGHLRALADRSEALAFLAKTHAAELGATLSAALEEGTSPLRELSPLSLRRNDLDVRSELMSRLRDGRSVSDLHLVGVDLRQLDLEGAGLAGLDLTGIDLRGCDLRRADLRRSVLVAAKLGGANLAGANLEDADLRGASLDRARLDNARLSNANFTGAAGSGASFTGATGARPIFAAADWKESDFREVDFEEADFTSAALVSTRFKNARLFAARFLEATMKSASFDEAEIGGASFERATLLRASFRETKGAKCTFRRATIAFSTFEEAKLGGADFERAPCKSVVFREAHLEGAQFRRTMGFACDFDEASMTGASFHEAHFRRSMFSRAGMRDIGARRVGFTECTMREADLRGADLREGSLRDSDLSEARLEGAELHRCDLKGVKLEGTKLTLPGETAHAGRSLLPES